MIVPTTRNTITPIGTTLTRIAASFSRKVARGASYCGAASMSTAAWTAISVMYRRVSSRPGRKPAISSAPTSICASDPSSTASDEGGMITARPPAPSTGP